MSTFLKFIGAAGAVGAACAACCAIPVIFPLLAGLGLGGVAVLDWRIGLGLLVATSAVSILVLRRRAATAPACSTIGGCGCAPKTHVARAE